jgi:hypothetical protein
MRQASGLAATGDHLAALPHVEAAVRLYGEDGNSSNVLSATSMLAVVHWNIAQSAPDDDAALAHFRASAELVERTDPGSEDLAQCHREIAAVLLRRSDLAGSEVHLRQRLALLLQRVPPSPAAVAAALNDLGFVLVQSGGDDEEILELSLAALAAATSTDPTGSAATTAREDLSRFAARRSEAGRQAHETYDRSAGVVAFEQSARAARAIGDEQLEFLCRIWQGRSMGDLGGTGGTALEDMQRAVELGARLEPGSFSHGIAVQSLARVLRERGHTTAALEQLDLAVEILQTAGSESDVATAMLDRTRTQIRERDFAAAAISGRAALDLFVSTDPRAAKTGEAHSAMASILLKTGAPAAQVPFRDAYSDRRPLGVEFAIGRWIWQEGSASSPPQRIPVRNAFVVSPDYAPERKLTYAAQRRRAGRTGRHPRPRALVH